VKNAESLDFQAFNKVCNPVTPFVIMVKSPARLCAGLFAKKGRISIYLSFVNHNWRGNPIMKEHTHLHPYNGTSVL